MCWRCVGRRLETFFWPLTIYWSRYLALVWSGRNPSSFQSAQFYLPDEPVANMKLVLEDPVVVVSASSRNPCLREQLEQWSSNVDPLLIETHKLVETIHQARFACWQKRHQCFAHQELVSDTHLGSNLNCFPCVRPVQSAEKPDAMKLVSKNPVVADSTWPRNPCSVGRIRAVIIQSRFPAYRNSQASRNHTSSLVCLLAKTASMLHPPGPGEKHTSWV